MQAGETVLKLFPQIRNRECAEVSSSRCGWIRGILPRELVKRFAFLDAGAKIPSFRLGFYGNYPQSDVLRLKEEE
jgi:hypothetical protein